MKSTDPAVARKSVNKNTKTACIAMTAGVFLFYLMMNRVARGRQDLVTIFHTSGSLLASSSLVYYYLGRSPEKSGAMRSLGAALVAILIAAGIYVFIGVGYIVPFQGYGARVLRSELVAGLRSSVTAVAICADNDAKLRSITAWEQLGKCGQKIKLPDDVSPVRIDVRLGKAGVAEGEIVLRHHHLNASLPGYGQGEGRASTEKDGQWEFMVPDPSGRPVTYP